MIPTDFKGRAKRLDAIDLPRTGKTIGVGEDEIRAVLEVESRGSGFDKSGRPIILFEPHVFWRLLGKGTKRIAAEKASLAYAKWGAHPYPRDSYPRLIAAIKIDETAAMKACSWGLPQIMGENFAAAGYGSVQEMVEAFCEDEENHLVAMVRFIVKAGLAGKIKAHDWAGFARGYNGPGYAKNRYDTRLAAAFAKWKKIPDTPFNLSHAAAETEREDAAPEVVERVETKPIASYEIKAVQARLAELGYHEVGMADGKVGSRTVAAVSAFQSDNGLTVTGEIDDQVRLALETAPARKISAARADGVPDSDAAKDGAVIGSGGKIITGGGLILAAPEVLEKVEQTRDYAERAKALIAPVKDLLADVWPFLLIGAGIWLWLYGGAIVKDIVGKFQSGELAK